MTDDGLSARTAEIIEGVSRRIGRPLNISLRYLPAAYAYEIRGGSSLCPEVRSHLSKEKPVGVAFIYDGGSIRGVRKVRAAKDD